MIASAEPKELNLKRDNLKICFNFRAPFKIKFNKLHRVAVVR